MDSTVTGAHPTTIHEKYTSANDGKTLEIHTQTNAKVKRWNRRWCSEKQPDAAGEELRKPEQAAGEHFKNGQLLKDVPSSEFIDTMRYFSASLGVTCEHCHVQGHFDSDEKKEKLWRGK